MPARKTPRTKPRPTSADQLLARRVRVAELSERGYTQHEIAAELGIGQTTVHRDMAEVRKMWRERAATSLQEAKAEQVAIIRAVQQEGWRAFRRSQELARKQTTRKKHPPAKGKAKQNPAADVESIDVEESQVGDPRFLDIVIRASERLGRLLGLDDPEQIELSGMAPAAQVNVQVNVGSSVQQVLNEPGYLDYLRGLAASSDPCPVRPDGEPGALEAGPTPGGDRPRLN